MGMKTGNGRIKIKDHPSFSDEKWTEITDFPNYFIHPFGFVKSVATNTNAKRREKTTKEKILSIFTVKGYLSVNLFKIEHGEEVRKSARIHSLVAHYFIGERPLGLECMHLDGDKTNCRVENLRYGSRSCNEAFKVDHGTALIGERHHQAKLTTSEVVEIRKLSRSGSRGRMLGKIYGVSEQAISRIINGKNWKSEECFPD